MTWALREWYNVMVGAQALETDRPIYNPYCPSGLGKLLNLCVPQFLHLQSGDDGLTHLMGLLGQSLM